MAPPRKSVTIESETTLTVSSHSSRTAIASTKGSGRSSKPPAKAAKGSTARSRSQSGSRATTSRKSPGRAPRSPQKEKAPRKASRSPAKKATTKSPARKSPSKKSPARKSPARKSQARTTGRTRSPAKTTQSKSPARKSPGRKAPVRKSPARKSVASKSPAKKTPAKTARASSKSPARTTRRKMSISPARKKKDPPKTSHVTPSPSLVSSPSENTAVRRRSNLLSNISLTASLPVVNSLTRRSSTATSVHSGTAPAGYSSQPSLPQGSSQGIATMQSSSFLRGNITAPASFHHFPAVHFSDSESSLEDGHGLGSPSASKKHLELRSNGGVKGVSRMGSTRLQLSVRVPPGVWATIKAIFWLAFLPSVVVLPHMLCRREQCTVMQAPRIPRDLASYFHWKLYPGYAGFLLLQALVQALPLGRRMQGFPSKALRHRIAFDYALNGWVNLLVTVGAFGALTHYSFPVTVPYRYSLQLLLTTVVFAHVLSVVLYLKGRWAPWEHLFPPGNIGNRLNDFVEGRELSPRICKCYDLATLCFRCGLLTWVVLLGSMAWDQYNANGRFDHGFALSTTCQFLYICMIFFDEEYFLCSALVTEEGMGYVSVMQKLVLVPFLGVLPPKFLLEQRPPTLPVYVLAPIGAVFLLGLFGMHLAHKRKYLFRRNWPDPTARGLGMDYLADGNRLMISGLWGLVRHPNYLADLLCHLAFALPCGDRDLLPYYSVLLSAVFLVARTVELEWKCQDRYGDLWTRYTEQVKYRLVPYIF